MTEKKRKRRTVYRDKIWIDPKIVSDKYKHAKNHVEYYCYKEVGKSTRKKPYIPKDPVKEFKATKTTYVCFSSFLSVISKSRNMNRILYKMTTDKSACVKLTLKEQRRFIELSVQHRMLPKYVTPDTIAKDGKSGTMVLLLENIAPSQVYMYLSQYRYLREDPGFVRSIVHLHDNLGMNFYAAFVLASRVSIDYTVHHFLTLQRLYASSANVNEVEVPFHIIAGLKRFVYRPHKYDNRKVMDFGRYYSYEAASRIESICKIKISLTAQELFEPLVIKAFSALTDKVAQKYIDQYLRLKERIQYRDKKQNSKAKTAVGTK